MLPRSVGPAGLITASAHDVLTFARMHLDGGVAPGGARLLAETSAAAMREPQFPVPAIGSSAQAVGLSWRLFGWGGHHVFGHDGNTIGQTAYLRIDPEAGIAVCLLTNSSGPQVLYQRLFREVVREHAGVEMPAEPEPAEPAAAGSNGVGRHAGRYERTSRSFDVAVRDGRLHALVTVTGQLAELSGSEPEEVELLLADGSGDHFLCRSEEDEPWTPVSFGALSDGTPYLFSGGRINLRVSLAVADWSRAAA
jgi:CubicO group peptidase (beta-lactamase class C family)